MTLHPVELELRRVNMDLATAQETLYRWERQISDFRNEVARLEARRDQLTADMEKIRAA